MTPTGITGDDSPFGQICADVFGPGWSSLRIAHLAPADRIGVEFDGNQAPEDNLPFRQYGMFHFAIQAPDVEGLPEKIVAAGGK